MLYIIASLILSSSEDTPSLQKYCFDSLRSVIVIVPVISEAAKLKSNKIIRMLKLISFFKTCIVIENGRRCLYLCSCAIAWSF